MTTWVGETPVNHEAERELYREIYEPGYREEKDAIAAADYYANLRRARARLERGALDALDRIESRCTPNPRPVVGGLEEVAEERGEEGA